jgi:hypothetical protein
VELDARGRRLRPALAAVLVRDNAPELRLVREWLDSWSGIGLIIAGMTHQDWDVQLTALRGARLARELLPGRHRALHRRRLGVGADAVAGGAAGGVGRHRPLNPPTVDRRCPPHHALRPLPCRGRSTDTRRDS